MVTQPRPRGELTPGAPGATDEPRNSRLAPSSRGGARMTGRAHRPERDDQRNGSSGVTRVNSTGVTGCWGHWGHWVILPESPGPTGEPRLADTSRRRGGSRTIGTGPCGAQFWRMSHDARRVAAPQGRHQAVGEGALLRRHAATSGDTRSSDTLSGDPLALSRAAGAPLSLPRPGTGRKPYRSAPTGAAEAAPARRSGSAAAYRSCRDLMTFVGPPSLSRTFIFPTSVHAECSFPSFFRLRVTNIVCWF